MFSLCISLVLFFSFLYNNVKSFDKLVFYALKNSFTRINLWTFFTLYHEYKCHKVTV